MESASVYWDGIVSIGYRRRTIRTSWPIFGTVGEGSEVAWRRVGVWTTSEGMCGGDGHCYRRSYWRKHGGAAQEFRERKSIK